MVNNYRPIFKLCVSAEVLERLVYNQLKSYLDENTTSPSQSDFRILHSNVTASLILIDMDEALDSMTYCTSLCIGLSKAC